jgi:predicted metal-dependent hydrolase
VIEKQIVPDGWQPLEDTIPKEILRSEAQAWARRIKVDPKAIHIRPMTRKWGSCSTAGRVTLDAGLLAQPADFRKQVIVHELLHLRVPNHGKLFKALPKALSGDRDYHHLTIIRM